MARAADLRGAGVHVPGRCPDQRLDLACRGGAALRERTHLGGQHGQGAPLFARACGFDGGIQREDVGLERQAFDHADDLPYTLRTGLDALHRRHRRLDRTAAVFDELAHAHGHRAGRLGALHVLAHRSTEFLHAGGGLLQA